MSRHKIRILVGRFGDVYGILEAIAEGDWDAGRNWSKNAAGIAEETIETWVVVDTELQYLFPDAVKGVVGDES